MLIRVSRPLFSAEHRQLRRHIPETNRLGDLSIRWRKFGEAGLTLIDRGEFQRVISKRAANLATTNLVELAQELNDELNQAPYNEHVTSAVTDVDYMGTGRFRSIAYILESEQLKGDHAFVTRQLDMKNGINSGWREFEPHVTLATIPEANMDESVLDAFWNFAPKQLTLMPARAEVL